jgi:hypothetical protein
MVARYRPSPLGSEDTEQHDEADDQVTAKAIIAM